MRETVWHILLILLVTGVVFFSNLGTARLWDRDEPRNAGCAAEMLERGDWVVPIFNDELRHQKPVLLYWLIMSAYSVFGVNEFSARFWSAALAIGTTFATYAIARRLLNSRIAIYAAIALATSLMFDVAARAATPDSVLTFFATSALAVFVLGTFIKTDAGLGLRNAGKWFPQNYFVVAAMYGLMGMAVLAKGPVGFLLPMAMIGMFLLIQRLPSATKHQIPWWKKFALSFKVFHPVHFAKTLWSMRPITAAVVILAVAAPWYLMVDARTEGDFTRLFFVGEHVGRATTALENHSGGLWFYPLAILVGFFPWSVFWGPVVVGLFKKQMRSALPNEHSSSGISQAPIILMICWIGVQVGAYSMAQTKLPSYVTPCYPALAILTATCLISWATGLSSLNRNWFLAAMGGLVIAGIGITVGVGIATQRFLPSQFWLTSVGLIPLIGGIVLLHLIIKRRTTLVPPIFAAMSVLFCLTLFGVGTVSLDGEQQSHKIMAALGPDDQVATYGCLESSWVFYARRPVYELATDDLSLIPNDAQLQASRIKHSFIKRPFINRSFWQPKPRVTPESFLELHQNAVFITTDDQLDSIKKRLPENFEVLERADYFLKNKQIILLGRRADRTVKAEITETHTRR